MIWIVNSGDVRRRRIFARAFRYERFVESLFKVILCVI